MAANDMVDFLELSQLNCPLAQSQTSKHLVPSGGDVSEIDGARIQ